VNYAGPIKAEVDDRLVRVRAVTRAAGLTSSTSSISISRLLLACALPGTAVAVAAFALPRSVDDRGDMALAVPAASPVRSSPIMPAPPPAALPEALVAPGRAVVRVPLAEAPLPHSPRGTGTALAAKRAEPARIAAPQMLAALSLPIAPAADAQDGPAGEAAPSAVLAEPLTVDPVPEAAAVPLAFGGARGSFAALAPSASVVGEALLAPEAAIIAAPSIPAPAREAAPGQRPALTDEAAPIAAPVADQALALAAPQAPLPATATPAARFVEAGPAPGVTPMPRATATAPVASAPVPAPVQVAVAPAPLQAAARASVSAPARLAASSPAPAPPRTGPAVEPRPQTAAPDAAALASIPPVQPLSAPAAGSLSGRADALAIDIRSQLVTRVDGKAVGKVDFRQTSSGLAVRLGSLVELLGDRYEAAQIARIRASAAGDVYLSLAQLRAQGIPISYDPVYDEFNVGLLDTRPKAAHKVHVDQISTPELGLGSTSIDQIPRR
jgi:hypothetical protein